MRSVLFAVTALVVILLSMAFASPTNVRFVSSNWENAQAQAKEESKLFFVDFDASYCASCRNMDESTYQDNKLANFIKNNVVALRLDVQDFDGVMWSQKYEVEALPTMLIFNEKGQLVKRLVGYKNASELVEAFEEAQIGELAPNANRKTPKISPQPISEDQPIVRPSSNTTNVSKPVTFKGFGASFGKPLSQGKGLYEIDVQKLEKKQGFGVQLGVFSSQATLFRQIARMKKIFPRQTSMVHIDEMKGKEVFKLIFGKFNTHAEATNFLKKAKKSGVEGLVKDLSLLK